MNGVFYKALWVVGGKPGSILSFGRLETRPRRHLASPHPCPPSAGRQALLLWVIMNHGNWLRCHTSNPPVQGLTAAVCDYRRSSLLRRSAANGFWSRARQPDGPCGVTRPSTVANARRSLTSAGWNEDVYRFKYHSGAFSRLTQSPRRHLPSLVVHCHPS